MDLFQQEYQSTLNFCGESKSRLEIKEFPVDMPFPGEGVLKRSTHTHTHVYHMLCFNRSATKKVNTCYATAHTDTVIRICT